MAVLANGHSATLLVGSMAVAPSYQAELALLKEQGAAVRAEMADRIVDGAALLERSSFSRAIVILAPNEQQIVLSNLASHLLSILAPHAALEVRDAAANATALVELLSNAGFAGAALVEGNVTATASPAQSSSLKRSAEDALATPSATSVPLKLRPKGASAAKKASLWALTRETNGASTPSIDESTLLTEEDLARRETIQRPDCDVKRTRKACKNCSCGLRELLLQEADDLPASMGKNNLPAPTIDANGVKVIDTGAFTSSCGSCGLGDGFRCSSCPYLGLPPFQPGQKVELPAAWDDDL